VKIHEVLHAVIDRMRQIERDGEKPQITIYMSNEFYHDCKIEIDGPVTPTVLNFYMEDKIFGFPVYVAHSQYKSHPSFTVANV